ncbi:MAG: STAS/SEC14 domain-containing protein [Cellvibrionaceae bacterium]|nr:STAS/SEC14 domain-containing protein [Cellvibrionaceae bacterium]
MAVENHGLSVGIERINQRLFCTIKAVGKLTHEDYEVIVPLLEGALAGLEHPQLDILVDASELDGWELRAAWDDLKLGFKHGKEFRKIAIFGLSTLSELTARLGSWFIAGQIKAFDGKLQAIAWLEQP